MTNSVRARRLALSIIDGEWTPGALTERLQTALQNQSIDCKILAARLYFNYETPPLSFKTLAAYFLLEPRLRTFWQNAKDDDLTGIALYSPLMQPVPNKLITFPLPQFNTTTDVAHWLALHPRELDWMADINGRQACSPTSKLHHYRYRWIEKRGSGQRLIEIPKSRLKIAQRQILREILDRLLPHDNAHGFIRKRSRLSYVQHHIDQPVLLHLDLRDFFHSVPTNKLHAFFRTLGYPPPVSRILWGLCTHATSPTLAGAAFDALDWHQRKQLQLKHLPQGAPTSAALANLRAYRLDCRLTGLADKYGWHYSRYADDLLISGPESLAKQAHWLEALVGAIALDEGFKLNYRKTRIRTQAQCQRVTGLVINKKANISRQEFDRLKATLTNCVRHGPTSQNRNQHSDFRAHLAGRIANITFVNPQRGSKLQNLFNNIHWPEE